MTKETWTAWPPHSGRRHPIWSHTGTGTTTFISVRSARGSLLWTRDTFSVVRTSFARNACAVVLLLRSFRGRFLSFALCAKSRVREETLRILVSCFSYLSRESEADMECQLVPLSEVAIKELGVDRKVVRAAREGRHG